MTNEVIDNEVHFNIVALTDFQLIGFLIGPFRHDSNIISQVNIEISSRGLSKEDIHNLSHQYHNHISGKKESFRIKASLKMWILFLFLLYIGKMIYGLLLFIFFCFILYIIRLKAEGENQKELKVWRWAYYCLVLSNCIFLFVLFLIFKK